MKTNVIIKPEYWSEYKGRRYARYAGLLDASHEVGLVSIETEMVQIPVEGNDREAVCHAIVTYSMDGQQRRFAGIGDASPRNVSSQMVSCLCRMSETRAKARAMRDALNLKECSWDELPSTDTRVVAQLKYAPIVG